MSDRYDMSFSVEINFAKHQFKQLFMSHMDDLTKEIEENIDKQLTEDWVKEEINRSVHVAIHREVDDRIRNIVRSKKVQLLINDKVNEIMDTIK